MNRTTRCILGGFTALLLAPLAALPAAENLSPPVPLAANKADPLGTRSPSAISWHSDPVVPGEVVLVEGGNFPERSVVEMLRLSDGPAGEPGQGTGAAESGKAETTVVPWQQTDTSMKFPVPRTMTAGIFACRVTGGGKSSKWVWLNEPAPWWQQGDWGKEASPGGWLRIFGRCLSFQNKATVALCRGGKSILTLSPVKQECWSLSLELPKTLGPGEYDVWVHNCHGGATGWRKAGTVRVAVHAFPWKPDVFDVTRYGASPSDNFDSSRPVQEALDAAGANGGGIAYFPRGRYCLQKTVEVPRGVLIRGAGRELTQLYWPDRAEPLPALIHGTNSFGVEDLTIMAANHKYGIASEENREEGAGNIFLRRLTMDLNVYQYFSCHDTSEAGRKRFLARSWPMLRYSGCFAVYGENVQVTDCNMFTSGSPFPYDPHGIGMRYSCIRNNRFSVGDGNFCTNEYSQFIFEDNEINGSPMTRGGGGAGEHWYYARNKVGNAYTGDSELFTTDGGQHEPVKIASAEGTTVTLAAKPNWGYVRNWLKYLYITKGPGAGQIRRMVSHEDRKLEIAEPWDVMPDRTSEAQMSFCNLKFLFIDNTFHDGTTIQTHYAKELILAGNRMIRCPSMCLLGRFPNWDGQLLGNEILVGNGWRDPGNRLPPTGSSLRVGGAELRGAVLRRNVLHNNASIAAERGRNILIEGNVISKSDMGVRVDKGCSDAMVWNNRFEDVARPLDVSDDTWMHPAERLLVGATAAAKLLPDGGDALAKRWKPVLDRLRELVGQDAAAPEVKTAVRTCQAELLEQAAAWKADGYPLEFLRELAAVRLVGTPGKPLQKLLAAAVGGRETVNLGTGLPECSLPLAVSLEFLPLPACQVEDVKDLRLKPGAGGSRNVTVTLQPGIGGGPLVPVNWTAEGEGWKLAGKGRLKIGEGPIPIAQWAVCGPFPNATPGVPDEESVYGPERCLNPSTQFNTLEGRRGWQLVQSNELDFAQWYGQRTRACAYALAVLRVKKPTPVRIRVSPDWRAQSTALYYLNGQPVFHHLREEVGQACMLEKGDNLLLLKVAAKDKYWKATADVTVPDWVAPGEVQVVPVAQLASVPAFQVQQKPEIPERVSIDGQNWKLVAEDDFDRAKLGTEWKMIGRWAIKDGTLDVQDNGFTYLSFDRKIKGPVRVEFDVRRSPDLKKVPGAGPMLAVTLTKAHEVGDRVLWRPPAGCGYMLCLGWHDRKSNEIWRESEEVAVSTNGPLVDKTDGWHHAVAQFTPNKLTLWLDGKAAVEYAETKWLPDLDMVSFFGGMAQGQFQVDNMRIYEGL